MDLAQDKDRWQALVITVIKFCGSIKCGEFLDYMRTYLASQEGLCSTDDKFYNIFKTPDLNTLILQLQKLKLKNLDINNLPTAGNMENKVQNLAVKFWHVKLQEHKICNPLYTGHTQKNGGKLVVTPTEYQL
jgi:hypothetical protein